MSRIDAGDALGIYRHFCKETEQVMEYLSNAKKLENLLQVPIPHLKHVRIPGAIVTSSCTYVAYLGSHFIGRSLGGIPQGPEFRAE